MLHVHLLSDSTITKCLQSGDVHVDQIREFEAEVLRRVREGLWGENDRRTIVVLSAEIATLETAVIELSDQLRSAQDGY